MALGNGLTEANVYNARLQACRINVNSSDSTLTDCAGSTPGGNVQDFQIGYGTANNGDVTSWSGTGSETFTRSYTYDPLNRISGLSDSVGGNSCPGLSWTYDPWGNRLTQQVTAGSCGIWNATYDAGNHITSTGFQYDAAGDLISDGLHSYTYDWQDHLTQVDGGATASYIYDENGQRVQRQVGSVSTSYLRDLNGNVVGERDGGCGSSCWLRGYVYFGGRLVAVYESNTTHFVHGDQLGSSRLMTDMSETVCYAQDYLPFGESNGSSGTCSTTHLFTGKDRDSESGLDDFGARYYSSQYGQFMTADWSAIPVPVPYANLTNPQTLNLYAIVHDNPVSFADLDGHCPDSGTPGCGPGDKFDRQYGGGKNQTAQKQQGQKPTFSQRLVKAFHAWLGNHPVIAGVLTRYMGTGEAQTAAKTGNIPNTDAAGNPRPTHFTKDDPVNDPQAAQSKYELPNTPTHRATVPEDRVPNTRIPDSGPTTSGGGSQVVTDDPVPVMPDEIVPLDPIIIDPLL